MARSVPREGVRTTSPLDRAGFRRDGDCMGYEVTAVGRIESPLIDRASAPRQGDEGAPDAWVVVAPQFTDAVADVTVGEDVLLLTWLDRADRDVQVVHPRGDVTRT